MRAKRVRRAPIVAEPEVQVSVARSITRREKLKQIARQHPERDEPRVDVVDEIRYRKK